MNDKSVTDCNKRDNRAIGNCRVTLRSTFCNNFEAITEVDEGTIFLHRLLSTANEKLKVQI